MEEAVEYQHVVNNRIDSMKRGDLQTVLMGIGCGGIVAIIILCMVFFAKAFPYLTNAVENSSKITQTELYNMNKELRAMRADLEKIKTQLGVKK